MLNACTVKCPEMTGCNHSRLAVTVDYRSYNYYERRTPEKKTQICWKAKVVVIWLLHCDRYMRQYYGKCYRDIQVYKLKKYITKVLKRNLLILKHFRPQNSPAIWYNTVKYYTIFTVVGGIAYCHITTVWTKCYEIYNKTF